MTWTNPPATESQPGHHDRLGQGTYLSSPSASAPQPDQAGARSPGPSAAAARREISVDKRHALAAASTNAELEVFTLTMGAETIELLPLKNWSQLDHYKWTVRGKLPAEPAGLEIAFDHVRVVGETVAINDPAGCLKLERLFNDWLRFERETLDLARRKARQQPGPGTPKSPAQPESQPLRFRVELDKRGQVHIHCLQGRDTLASIGLTIAGFNSLQQQGLIRKPRAVAAGALHDWIELDGELFSFDKGRNDAARLEQILNDRYVPDRLAGPGKEVLIYLNAASPTGFDIQFPVMVGGVPDNHRHHLNEHSLEALQDPDHCGLLHKEIIIKLIPPNLVFKHKTPDGGEQYLAWGPETSVNLTDEAGQPRIIHLSQPLNLMRVSPSELTAVFNHPAINRHMKAEPPDAAVAQPARNVAAANLNAPPEPRPVATAPLRLKEAALPEMRKAEVESSAGPVNVPVPEPAAKVAAPVLAAPLPNVWLKGDLCEPVHRHDWFACLVYSKMAERFGNSSEGKFGPAACWFIRLGDTEDIADPAFKGVFLTEKGSLGFLNQGQMARFYNGVAFVGTQEWALEGIQVNLIAVGLDADERVVFIVGDNYRGQFGVPETTLISALNRLNASGAVILSLRETLASREPLEVVWTVPAAQPDPNDPQAVESARPVG